MDKRKRRKINPINLGFVCETQLRTLIKASLASSETHLSTCASSQPKGREALLSLTQTCVSEKNHSGETSHSPDKSIHLNLLWPMCSRSPFDPLICYPSAHPEIAYCDLNQDLCYTRKEVPGSRNVGCMTGSIELCLPQCCQSKPSETGSQNKSSSLMCVRSSPSSPVRVRNSPSTLSACKAFRPQRQSSLTQNRTNGPELLL